MSHCNRDILSRSMRLGQEKNVTLMAKSKMQLKGTKRMRSETRASRSNNLGATTGILNCQLRAEDTDEAVSLGCSSEKEIGLTSIGEI